MYNALMMEEIMVKIISLDSNLSQKVKNSSRINEQYTPKKTDLNFKCRDLQKEPDNQPISSKEFKEPINNKT
jgi:hypothetical protein